MAYQLGPDDLDALALGGGFFGSGGGGTIESARHLAANFRRGDYYPTETIQVVSVAEATDGEAVMVAYMGAPEAINHAMYPSGPVAAASQVQQRLAAEGRKLAYIAPPESGALGFVVACLVAAKLGLSVIDADGAGRAVPSLPMLTYAAAEISPRPAFLVSQGGLCVELDVSPRQGENGGPTHQQDVSTIVEQMMRPIVAAPEFGQFGGLAMWVMSTAELPAALPIRGTLNRALVLGKALASGRITTASAMIDYLAGQFEINAIAVSEPGELVSAQAETTGGFDLGKVQIRADRQNYTVVYQNESLIAWSNSRPQPLAMAPDSLAYFVEGAGQSVFSNGDLSLPDGSINPAIGKRPVVLLAWQAEPALRVADGLILESFLSLLASLGYLGPYCPVQDLSKQGEKA